MEEKTNTVIKIINTILCIGIIASVCVNVYQSKESSILRSEIATLEAEIKTLETERDTLNKEVETKQNEESDLSKQIGDLQKKIEQLEADNRSLSDSLKALEERQKEEAAVKDNTSDTVESDTKVQESKPSSNDNTSSGGNGGGGSTTPSGSDGQKLMDALKQLGIDPNDDVSNDVAAPAPEWGHVEGGEGIEAY
ncbi:hypothetical protein [uncultured Bacteroides sp.]|jgi:TolA-binding protein|uniref:hypothetical protein n=1 Tax=uncultured Bacteroides sp. TaxID=162156 RepID=UPI0025B6C264|nr:hypothetical protein [uncultured Bacteroides sp.]